MKKEIEDLLNIWDNGKVQADEFSETRIFSSFKSSENKITVQKDNKIKEIDENRNIIGKLLSFSIKANQF